LSRFLGWAGWSVAALLGVAMWGGVRCHLEGQDLVRVHLTIGMIASLAALLVQCLLAVQVLALAAPLRTLARDGMQLRDEIAALVPPVGRVVLPVVALLALGVAAPIVALAALDGGAPRWLHGALELGVVAGHVLLLARGLATAGRLRLILVAVEREARG
jgi:hypothetical protein